MLSKQIALHSVGAFGATFLMAWLQIRTYGILCVIALGIWLYKTNCPYVSIIVPDTLRHKIDSMYGSFTKLRTDKPGAFCIIFSFVFILLAIFGHIVSGTWIVIICLMLAGLISTKHQFKIINKPTEGKILWTLPVVDHDIDEFLPKVNARTLFMLQRAGEGVVICSKNKSNPIAASDEANDFRNDDNENDDDELDDDNKSEPEVPLDLIIPNMFPDLDDNLSDSISDIDEPNLLKLEEIRFNTKHFNKESSSSSDDDSITKGLSFKNISMTIDSRLIDSHTYHNQPVSLQQEEPSSSSSMLTQMAGMVPWSLVNNFLKTAAEERTREQIQHLDVTSSRRGGNKQLQESVDDNDYVFVNSEDLNS